MRWIITGTCLVGMLLVLGCRKPFSGDGVVTDNGTWSYPRYAIAFDSLNATNDASRTYRFTGTPSAAMTFGLVLTGVSGRENAATALQDSKYDQMIVRVKITKEGGTVVATSEAALKDWQVSQSSQRVMLWHKRLRDVNFERKYTYAISVSVSGVDAIFKPLLLRPVLEGGGNETP